MKRVLIVEDDFDAREIYRIKMKQSLHHCDIAGSACEAFKLWIKARDNKTPYDLVVLDIGLEDMSGVNLAQLLACSGDEIKIRFLTGSVQERNEDWARIVGAEKLWRKPEDVSRLCELVDKTLAGE